MLAQRGQSAQANDQVPSDAQRGLLRKVGPARPEIRSRAELDLTTTTTSLCFCDIWTPSTRRESDTTSNPPTMCRICGRTIKCIFDNMPSRTLTHHIPSRRYECPPIHRTNPPTNKAIYRTFTTLRQTRPQPLQSRSPPSAPSLTRALSTLTLSPTTTALRRPAAAPSSLLTIRTTAQQLLPSVRTFSTTAAALGSRRRMDTFSPSRRVQKRRHGYLARLRSKSGRKVLKSRALRGRKDLSW